MSARKNSRSQPGDYRVFLGAFPQGKLVERIQALREMYDPKTARITAPHVTLAGTYWRSGPPTLENERRAVSRLESVQRELSPFHLVVGGIRSFPPVSNPVVYLDVEVTPQMLATRRVLLDALGPDRHPVFAPHLTLAMRLGRRGAQEMLADLRDSPWHTRCWRLPVRALSLMQRGPDDPAWREIARIPLDGA